MKLKMLGIAITAMALFSGNVEKAQASDAELFGAVIGAATGGFLGSNLGSGDDQLAATAVATLIGAVIGSNMAQSGTYESHGEKYRVWYPEPSPVYTPPKPKHKVVIHRHKVIVKHLYPKDHQDSQPHKYQHKAKKKHQRRFEKRRQRLAKACYYNPRRCARAF